MSMLVLELAVVAKVKDADIRQVRLLPDGVAIGVSKGSKSSHDFRVHFKWGLAGSKWRTPTHVHLIVDMYTKRMGNPWITNRFVDHVLDTLIGCAVEATGFPPTLAPLEDDLTSRFRPLNAFGEYTIEFILTVQGLIATSEKTNYPNGHLQEDMWRAFRDGAEIYKVLGIALR
jgi:hypothetical protein